MIAILDANILIRLSDQKDGLRTIALSAVDNLRRQNFVLRCVPQCEYEFWVVATRPIPNNGLGYSVPECVRELATIAYQFPLLNDLPNLFAEWRTLVETYACTGKVAHDARYVAAMKTHGVTHILTFNVGDFARYHGITVIDPRYFTSS